MKIRTDFVSNSSSSSFIVKIEKDTPSIFVGKKLSFSDFAERWLRRDVIDCIYDACDGWYTDDIRKSISLIDDAKYVEEYASHGMNRFSLPKCCVEFVKRICELVEKIRNINAEKPPRLFENGKISEALTAKWRICKFNRLDSVKDELEKTLDIVYKRITELLKSKMGDWKFYYTELEDSDGDEQRGFDRIGDTSWHRIFSNH